MFTKWILIHVTNALVSVDNIYSSLCKVVMHYLVVYYFPA